MSNGVKLGCVLVPTLFFILFAAILLEAFSDCDISALTGNSSTCEDSQVKTKVLEVILCEFLFADDCAPGAYSHEEMQYMTDHFASSCRSHGHGLTVNLEKTEAMFSPSPSQAANVQPPPPIVINKTEIKTMDKYCFMQRI